MGHLLEESLSCITKTRDEINGDDDTDLALAAVRLANVATFPMVFKAAIELGVLDTLYLAAARGDGIGASSSFLSASEVAIRLPTKPSNPEAPVLLDRMLRLLSSYSMVKCQAIDGQRVYKAEPICKYFLKDCVIEEMGTLASQYVVTLDSVFLNTWQELKDVVLEGGHAFGRANGDLKLFDYISQNERLSNLFNRTGFSVGVLKKILQVYRGFEGVEVCVDVGGGVGNTLSAVTSVYPNMQGINFDLTCALERAPSYPNVEHVAGDMFVDIPNGDAIILKRMLHDWNDEDCFKILNNCWKALPENGKVIVLEVVIPEEAECRDVISNIAFDMDMLMLTQLSGGKERTRAEYEELAAKSSFAHCNFVCPAYHLWVIEFTK